MKKGFTRTGYGASPFAKMDNIIGRVLTTNRIVRLFTWLGITHPFIFGISVSLTGLRMVTLGFSFFFCWPICGWSCSNFKYTDLFKWTVPGSRPFMLEFSGHANNFPKLVVLIVLYVSWWAGNGFWSSRKYNANIAIKVCHWSFVEEEFPHSWLNGYFFACVGFVVIEQWPSATQAREFVFG